MINVEFNAEEVNKHIAQEIMKSIIGKNLEASIQTCVHEILTSNDRWDNPLKRIVGSILKEYAVEVMMEEQNKNKIQNRMREILSSSLSEKLAEDLCIDMSEKIVDAVRNG